MVVGGLLCHFGGLLCLEAALYISLIDFEKFRCYCLLRRSVGFSFFYHLGCLCIWTVLVGWFVIVPDLEWSNYNWRGGQVSTDRKSWHWPTYAGLWSGAGY